MLTGVPLALDSWWGLAILALAIPALVWRILDEEKHLASPTMFAVYSQPPESCGPWRRKIAPCGYRSAVLQKPGGLDERHLRRGIKLPATAALLLLCKFV